VTFKSFNQLIASGIFTTSFALAFCQLHPNIVYIDRTLGAGDIEFDFEVKNLAHFMKIMDDIKKQLKGIIRNFEYFSVLKIYKTQYFPVK
jgi:hypothetical protein